MGRIYKNSIAYGSKGEKGTTFLPSIAPVKDDNNNVTGYKITWTNDGGVSNPEPIILTNGENGENGINNIRAIPYNSGFRHTDIEFYKDSTKLPSVASLPWGVTFTPVLTQTNNGYTLSWTNDDYDQEAENPDPITILNGEGVPSGGTRGQVLIKKSSDDYDTEWVTPTEGSNVNPGLNGVTYTPVVTQVTNGYELSWTNDGGLTNPETITILNGQNGVGERGQDGQDGQNGQDGTTYTPTIGTVTTLEEGSQATASVQIAGTNAVFNFGIPKGDTGAAGSSGSSTGVSGITYAYNTEIDTGDTYYDGRKIYMQIFHLSAGSAGGVDNIPHGISNVEFIACIPAWKYNSVITTGNVIEISSTGISGSSASAVASNVNKYIIDKIMYAQVTSDYITVFRGSDRYNREADIFLKYVKASS